MFGVAKTTYTFEGLREFLEEAFEYKLGRLNLSLNQLPVILEIIKELPYFQKLDLSNNDQMEGPECIGGMKQFREFELSGHKMKAIPERTGDLAQLKKLYLSNNNLLTVLESMEVSEAASA